MDYTLVDSILITHTHFDHILGLPAFLFKIWIQIGKTPPIFVPQNSKTMIGWLVKSMPIVPKIRVNELNCSRRINIAGLEMSCATVDHGDHAIAYCLTNSSRKLVYTGDTRPCASVEELATGADVLIHDCTFGDSERKLARQTGHSTATEAAGIASKAQAKMLVLVHISEQYYGREEVLVKQAQNKYRGKIVVARDLLKITL
jgi:ribonuclease BN (tRNA processing enzyme)